MWARVKGKTENDLLKLPFKAAYMFRPAGIQPLHGIRSKTGWVQAIYVGAAPLLSLLNRVAPKYMTTTEQVGRAMIGVASDGFPRPVLESEDINKLSPPRHSGARASANPESRSCRRGFRVRRFARPGMTVGVGARPGMTGVLPLTPSNSRKFHAFAIWGPFALYFISSQNRGSAWIAFASSAAASSTAPFRFRARRTPRCR